MELTITDASGAHVRTLEGPGDAGMHEVQWNWRYDAPYEAERGGGGSGASLRPRRSRAQGALPALDSRVDRDSAAIACGLPGFPTASPGSCASPCSRILASPRSHCRALGFSRRREKPRSPVFPSFRQESSVKRNALCSVTIGLALVLTGTAFGQITVTNQASGASSLLMSSCRKKRSR